MKEFYPDYEYNREKRKKYFTLLILACVLMGGVGVTFIILDNLMIGLISLGVLVIGLVTLPSALSNYPLKKQPLIEVGDGKVKLYGKEEYSVKDVLIASVMIDVPNVKGTKEEKVKFLNEIASTKPSEPVTGACDVLVKDAKGKEITKYNIVADSIGALQALLEAGVKQYRVIYAMKNLSVKAKYRVRPLSAKEQAEFSEMTENDKLMQLI